MPAFARLDTAESYAPKRRVFSLHNCCDMFSRFPTVLHERRNPLPIRIIFLVVTQPEMYLKGEAYADRRSYHRQ